ncbi:uncharacterized protein N7459_002308 [Penicillium hispanicum]|uniref:uncharacterized protein n=1 Tax=Penicillium hispanicum TaxID=1080232 RepID=UPI00253FA08D|nr:uncharacterized protein N7459_002308 [Penicillium hispanicum]KAJ5591939.1 hypothetical protein N7459_002308 [Penicillium hispanicum]
MSLEPRAATPTDAPRLAEVFLAAFSDTFNRTMFPPTPDVRAWAATHLLGGNGAQAHEVYLKIEDASAPGVVAAFAKWNRLAQGTADPHGSAPGWPASSDQELCDRFFGTMDAYHRRLMGDRPHYYLEILGVDPSYQGRGLASKLLKWGLARADEEGVEVYLSSSPEGRPVYEKYGFQSLESFSPFSGYEQVSMIRPARK